MDISTQQAADGITRLLHAGLVPNLIGSPGIGKSDIVRQVAEELNLKVIDFRLSQADPTDLNGFPGIDEDGRAVFRPNKAFPIEGDPLPVKDDGTKYDGWLLFLDEANSAPMAVQAAAYKLTLDKMVGEHNLHSNVAIVMAGNKTTDKAITNRMSTAMQSRVSHLNLEINKNAWLEWAFDNDIDHRVTSFIEFRPELLHKFDPNHADDTFPCPRTWAFLSKIIKGKQKLDGLDAVLAAGTVGQGPATEFKSFSEIFSMLPTIQDIIKKPEAVKIGSTPDIHYALSGLVANEVDDKNIDNLSLFVERLPKEFQVVTWRTAVRREPAIMQTDYIKSWITANAKAMRR